MASGHPTAAAPGTDPAAIAALLDWWRLAGVEPGTGDTPVPWRMAETAPAAPAAADRAGRPAGRAEAPARPAAPSPSRFDALASLEDLRALVTAEAPRAPLADGNPASGLMILGESPSAEDLETGRPFTGPAGRFLDRMLAAIGLDRSSAYVALLCPLKRVPGPPAPEDIAADLALTRAHIRLVAPRLLLLLGANPVQVLTGETAPISRVRGQWLSVEGPAGPIPALATFNPAYLLRRPEEKAAAWADLLALRRRLMQ